MGSDGLAELWPMMGSRDKGTGSLSRLGSGAGRGDRNPDPVGVVCFYKKEGE